MSDGRIINNPMSQTKKVGVSSLIYVNDSVLYAQATSPYKWTRMTCGYCTLPSREGMGTASSVYTGLSAPTLAPPNVGAAFARLAGQVADTPLNVWVSIGEAQETIAEIVSILRTIQKVMRLRDADFSSAGKVRKALRSFRDINKAASTSAKLWLHLRYGIRPLIADLKNALVVLETCGKKHRERFVANVPDESTSNTANRTFLVAEAIPDVSVPYQAKRSISRSIQAGGLYEPAFEELTLSELCGTGNLIQGLWDLVPFSFVADWFLGVSDWLSAWTPNMYVNPVCNWAKIVTTTVDSCTVLPNSPSVWPAAYSGYPRVSQTDAHSGYVSCTTQTVERVVGTTLPYLPELRVRMSWAKAADLLALLQQFKLLRWG
jgi:hypothetical protein